MARYCLIRGTAIEFEEHARGYLYYSSHKRTNQRRKVRRIPWQPEYKENNSSNKKENHNAFAYKRPGEALARLVERVEVVTVPHFQIGRNNRRQVRGIGLGDLFDGRGRVGDHPAAERLPNAFAETPANHSNAFGYAELLIFQ